MSSPEIRILGTPEELFRAAAEEFIRAADAAVQERGRFCVVLSGGSTPRGLYAALAGPPPAAVHWDKTYFFWGDERNVPIDHADSNYRMAFENLLSKVPAPREHISRVRTELGGPEAAARAYEQALQSFFGLQSGQFPRFDLILLGMGPDGHTASLFPETAALQERHRLVVANWAALLESHRITMTLPLINQARAVMFLVSGQEKAAVLRRVLQGDGAELLPARLVQPINGRLLWMLDQAAASGLPPRQSEE